MKKNIYNFICLLCISGLTFAQVGIKTNNPTSTLDVNGDLNVNGKFHVGGTDNVVGDAGTKNKALTSNGLDGGVSWEEVKIPVGYQGGLYLTAVEAHSDRAGLDLSQTGYGTYSADESLSGNWTEIPGLSKVVEVTHTTNKIHVQFQTTAQMNFSGSASFACGIFMDNQLKGVRVDIVRGNAGSFNVFNINSSFNNVSAGNHTFKVACRGRTFSNESGSLAIGKPNTSTNLNADMAQSSLSIYVLEDLLN